jgi:DNA-directed RNA polymerase specialized sigma24 family protein
MERNMQGSGTSHAPLDACETLVRDYLAQVQCTVAMGVLIQHYQDAIVRYCRCHMLDQEVAQEIFLTACAGLAGFRGHSSIKTWLYGIAWKKCVEVGRTRQRREALVRSHQATIGARVHSILPASQRTSSARSAADAGSGTRSISSASTTENS